METKALTCPICGAIVPKEKMKCAYCGADLIVAGKEMSQPISECPYLEDSKICRVIDEENGRILREEFCGNEMQDSCCYVCDKQEMCEMSCDLLRKPENVALEDSSQDKRKSNRRTT